MMIIGIITLNDGEVLLSVGRIKKNAIEQVMWKGVNMAANR